MSSSWRPIGAVSRPAISKAWEELAPLWPRRIRGTYHSTTLWREVLDVQFGRRAHMQFPIPDVAIFFFSSPSDCFCLLTDRGDSGSCLMSCFGYFFFLFGCDPCCVFFLFFFF